MEIKFTRAASFFITLGGLFAYILLSSYSTGITGQSTVGCGGGGCHGASSAGTIVSITGIPGAGWTTSTAYTVTITVSNTLKVAAGFDLTVSAGSLSAASSGATASGTEARHTTPKTLSSGTATWTVTWTSPASGSSAIFHLAGNAVNLNTIADVGDLWNITTQTYNAAASSATIPTITVGTATNITNTSAKLNASVNANGASTTVTFAYGLTTSYGSSATVTPSPVTGTTATAVSATPTGLTKGKTYHYRFTATNSAGTANSPDATFTTTALSIENLLAGGFKAYPNPVKDILILEGSSASTNMQWTIIDATGKSIAAQSWRDGPDYHINTSGLAKGFYVLRIRMDDKVYGSSFLKD